MKAQAQTRTWKENLPFDLRELATSIEYALKDNEAFYFIAERIGIDGFERLAQDIAEIYEQLKELAEYEDDEPLYY